MALEVVSEEEGFYKSTAAGLHCMNCTISAKILQQHYVRSLEPRRFLKDLTFFENEKNRLYIFLVCNKKETLAINNSDRVNLHCV